MDYQGSMARLEANVEEEYINMLRHSCYKENHQSKLIFYENFLEFPQKFIQTFFKIHSGFFHSF